MLLGTDCTRQGRPGWRETQYFESRERLRPFVSSLKDPSCSSRDIALGVGLVAAIISQRPMTVLPMNDGLPKLKDFPAELGGTGEMAA